MKQQILSKLGNCNVVCLFCKGFSNRGWRRWSQSETLCEAEWSSLRLQGERLVFGKGGERALGHTADPRLETLGNQRPPNAGGGLPRWSAARTQHSLRRGRGPPLFSAYTGKDESPKEGHVIWSIVHTLEQKSLSAARDRTNGPTEEEKKPTETGPRVTEILQLANKIAKYI